MKHFMGGAGTINETDQVVDIVRRYYQTADVFRRWGIDYCNGRISVAKVCAQKGLLLHSVMEELEASLQLIRQSNGLPYQEWDMDFLTDYIIHVHHGFLRVKIPQIREELEHFVTGHRKQLPYLDEVQQLFEKLARHIIPHLQQEEEIIFPYIRQIAHAYTGQEPYARLLVRTLRKPVEDVMNHEHNILGRILHSLRELTHNYQIPAEVCASHQVVFHKLHELDADLVQHIYLENNVLFPRAIAMEKELLQKQD